MDYLAAGPYIASVVTAAISGICSYLVARNKSSADVESLKKANQHEIDKLMKQHEADIDNLKEKHKLEMEKLEAEHRYAIELANSSAQNEMTQQMMGSLIGGIMSSPQVRNEMGKAITESIRKGSKK